MPTQTGASVAEVEPNSLPATAVTFAPGDNATGVITSNTDTDWWKVNLTQGQTIYLVLTNAGISAVCGGSTVLINGRLSVFAEQNDLNQALPDTLLETSTGSKFAWLVFTCVRTGTYYVRCQTTSSATTNLAYVLESARVTFDTPSAADPARDLNDIVVMRSTNGGASWSNRTLVNADSPVGYRETNPACSVDAAGVLRVYWLDRRETVAGTGTVSEGQLTDLYSAASADGGVSFGSGKRISDESGVWNPASFATVNVGTRNSAIAYGQNLMVAWGDARGSNWATSGADIYSARQDALVVEFTSGPAQNEFGHSTSARLEWTATAGAPPGTTVTYASSLDGEPFTAWSSSTGRDLTDLSEATHTLRVKARDVHGNESPLPASRTFGVDNTAPSVSVTSGPADSSVVGTADATFTWLATDAGVGGVQSSYRRDGGAWSADSPTLLPVNYAGLSVGRHVFEVRAHDALGNSSAASRGWTIDLQAPETELQLAPVEGATVTNSNVTLSWIGSDDMTPLAALRYQYQLVPAGFGVYEAAAILVFRGAGVA